MALPANATRSIWKLWEVATLFALVALLTFWLNSADSGYTDNLERRMYHTASLSKGELLVYKSTDEYFLLEGYKQTPALLTDGLAWWHGTWIHTYTHFFRPLTSYLHWFHIHIGLRYGFATNFWFGLAFYGIASLLSVIISWRMTRSKVATFFAALLVPFIRNIVADIPEHWLFWFPMHPDLLCGAFLLGATLCFDTFIEKKQRRFLVGTWLCWLLAALTKEHAYVFPLMALTLALFRSSAEPRRRMVLHSLALLGTVLLLTVYRKAVIPNVNGPSLATLDPLEILSGSISWMYRPLYLPLVLAGGNELVLAFLWFVQGLGYFRLRQLPAWKAWRKRPFSDVITLFGMIGVALLSTVVTDRFIRLFDTQPLYSLLDSVLPIIGIFCSLVILWRGRLHYPTVAIFLILYLAYLPVYFGHTWY